MASDTTSPRSGDEPSHVEANGIRFAYLEAGSGPLALLLHGFPDTAHSWLRSLRELAGAGYHAVAPFLRGYAPSEVPANREIPTELLGEDAIALVAALGYDSAVLIGHDWGAAAAYYAASLAPERFSKLVAVGVPHPASLEPSLKLAWAARHFIRFKLPGAIAKMQKNDFAHVDELVHRWSPTWNFGPEETAAVKTCFANRDSLDAALGYYRAAAPGKIPPALKSEIQVDTLVFAGKDDPSIALSAYQKAARKFAANYQVVELPGGHFVHRESPDGFHEELLKFVGPAS